VNPQVAQYETRYAEPAPGVAEPSLLDAALAATGDFPPTGADRPSAQALALAQAKATGRLDNFLGEKDVAAAIRLWIGSVPAAWSTDLGRHLIMRLNADVARIDELLNNQLNAILHHAAFQKLEAAWRGLKFLVDSVPEGANVKVRMLNVSWKEVVRDQERAIEFDQSQLFRKVYNDEFGMPGGEPFGMLVGNYDVCHRPYPDHPTDDLSALRGVAGVAAAAFAPFVCGIDPRFLELDSFAELEMPLDLERTFDQLDYLKWRAFREIEDARFVGLALPRVVYRRPYGDVPGATHGFNFREDASAADRSGYLWGSPVFAMASCAVRAFAETNWLADLRGIRPDAVNGGRVVGLPAIGYGTGSAETPRSVTDAHLTDLREKELSDLGFIPLCHVPGTAEAAFYTTPSAQKPPTFAEATATANARLSAMLHYVLCASRFAHYLKVMIRDQVGSFASAGEIEDRLGKWLSGFVIGNDDASSEQRAKYPLREANVRVREMEGKPGSFQCVVYLRPHFQLDQLSAGIRLTTQLTTATGT
jgi:type VI secretion system ImpC/EvpB family protein